MSKPGVPLKPLSPVNAFLFPLAVGTREIHLAYFHFPIPLLPLRYVITIPYLRRILKSPSIRLSSNGMQFDKNIREQPTRQHWTTRQTLLYIKLHKAYIGSSLHFNINYITRMRYRKYKYT